MRSVAVAAVVLLSPFLAVAACGPPYGPVYGTEAAAPGDVRSAASERVVQQIAQAACERERSCGTIGPGAPFASREQCLETMLAKYRPWLESGACPNGIERQALHHCIESFEAGECTSASDAISRSAECATSDLCLR
jgi:hypothetical protein